jgi:hypothetical protein
MEGPDTSQGLSHSCRSARPLAAPRGQLVLSPTQKGAKSLSLTAAERETVITFSEEDDTATVHTYQRRIITKLRNNPAATEVEDPGFDGTAGAVFEIPADLISFRSGRRKLSSEQARLRQRVSKGRGEPPSVDSEPDFVGYNRRFRAGRPSARG